MILTCLWKMLLPLWSRSSVCMDLFVDILDLGKVDVIDAQLSYYCDLSAPFKYNAVVTNSGSNIAPNEAGNYKFCVSFILNNMGVYNNCNTIIIQYRLLFCINCISSSKVVWCWTALEKRNKGLTSWLCP